MNNLQLLPKELISVVICNLDSLSQINLICTSKILFYDFKLLRNKEITKLYLYNNCENLSDSTKTSIIKNDNSLLNLNYKINLLKRFNNFINKRYYNG